MSYLVKKRQSAAPEALGDWLCFNTDCQTAVAAIDQMRSIYGRAPSSTQNKFGDAYRAIITSFNSIEENNRWGFSRCCEAKEVGKQAVELTKRMGEDSGTYVPLVEIKAGLTDQITGGIAAATNTTAGVVKYALYGGLALGAFYLYTQIKKKAV